MRSAYRLYDIYDGPKYLIGEFDTLVQVKRAAERWDVVETDGECDFALYHLKADGKYYLVRDWTY